MSRTAEIRVIVDLDDDDLPTRIEWQATEAKSDEPVPCQSIMFSAWDSKKKTSAAIDLWTKDTTVDDMNMHFYQVFHKMADTYLRATRNEEVAERIRRFGDSFGESSGLKLT